MKLLVGIRNLSSEPMDRIASSLKGPDTVVKLSSPAAGHSAGFMTELADEVDKSKPDAVLTIQGGDTGTRAANFATAKVLETRHPGIPHLRFWLGSNANPDESGKAVTGSSAAELLRPRSHKDVPVLSTDSLDEDIEVVKQVLSALPNATGV